MRTGFIFSLCAAAMLTACGGGADDYPALLPTARMLAEPALPAPVAASAPPEAAITTRADALRARAESLRRPVIDPATHKRMQRAPQG